MDVGPLSPAIVTFTGSTASTPGFSSTGVSMGSPGSGVFSSGSLLQPASNPNTKTTANKKLIFFILPPNVFLTKRF